MNRSIVKNFINFRLLFFGLISTFLIPSTNGSYPYYGTKIGALTQLHHGVSGDVYAVDSRTVFIKNFNYDGEAPAAYFYVGNTDKPSSDGWRLRDEKGSTSPVTKRYRNKDITLSLPEGKTLRDAKWFSFWCDEFAVNFGDVRIPSNLDYPKPQKISALKGVHGVSSDNIVIVDAQTLLIPNFSYDGEAPDAKFWVGRGTKPSPQGLRIPDENGKETPLRQYDKKTIVLTLPADLTIFDVGHFGVWCEAFTVDFGHIRIPDGLNVPPSLKMLGISPQSKLNCEVLYDDLAFEVRWAVAGESIVVQLVAKLDDNEYMSFGISPNKAKTEMIGADVVVAWVNKTTGKGFAQDYFLDDKSQCSGDRGSCPDVRFEDNTNSIRLLNAAMVNGYSIVTYQRSLKASDKYDVAIPINGSQAIAWAIGPLNQRNEVSFHTHYTKNNQFIDFGRQPTWNCPQPEPDRETKPESDENEEYYDARPQNQNQSGGGNRRNKPQLQESNRKDQPQSEQLNGRPRRPVPTPKPVSKNGAWEIPPIQCDEPDDGVFYAQLGPTGGKHGYPAITGHVGWGISWYINGLLIPEIHVVRGKTYTFVVESGTDSETPAKYHPFYITDDPIGGYVHKTEEEKNEVKIFAGIHKSRSGKITPTGVGRLCNWTPDQNGPSADEFQSFGAYQRTLTLKCENGDPGIITWTPDDKTPDTVYYHCFTHRYLGWKIHVHDNCDKGQASEVDEVYAEPDSDFLAESSIRHETRIRPNDFLEKHEKDLIKHHNMAGKPPKVHFDIVKSNDITKLITDGIKAAEALEASLAKTRIPLSTYPNLQTSAPEVLRGEMSSLDFGKNSTLLTYTSSKAVSSEIVLPQEHIVIPNSAPSAYLRPPSTAPLFRPVKNTAINRLPPPRITERRRPHRPMAPIVPQSSIIVNHYKKPVPSIMKPFVKEKPFPIQQIASVLLLGQPTELTPMQTEPLLKTKPTITGNIPVPYIDSVPQDTIKKYSLRNGSILKPKIPFIRMPSYPEKPASKPIVYKKPFEIKEIQELSEVLTLPPAVNTGFQEERVVVEGGFRPIVRRRTDDEIDDVDRVNRRQDEVDAEIDEVMETDTLFLSKPLEPKDLSFEPMFIPSPPDSTNSTIIRKSVDHQDYHLRPGISSDEPDVAQAERLDIYYLPPDPKKRPLINPVVKKDGPIIVTYDGKPVSDSSLVNSAPPNIDANDDNMKKTLGGISKTEQLVRNTPQFAPFRGEIPPPVPEVIPSDAPQLSKKGQQPHRPIIEYSNPLSVELNNTKPISTKLTLLKSNSS